HAPAATRLRAVRRPGAILFESMTYQGRASDGSAEYPRIASRRKATLSTPTLDRPFSSSCRPIEVSVSPVRLLTKRRVTIRKAQQHDEYSNPANWSRVFSSSSE